jgi:hypothetical protein
MRTRVVDRVPEWRYQAEVVARLHNLEAKGWAFTCAGDMAAGARSKAARALAKATGLTAGEPDVRVYLTGGRLLSIELKTPDGRRSKEQRERHARLIALGFEVLTIAAATPEAMADRVEAEIKERLSCCI